MSKIQIAFICTGNICRSPLGEGIFMNLIQKQKIQHHFHIESAGTGDWHVGSPPDPRSVSIAKEHGITLPSLAQQINKKMIANFDYIVAMDHSHLEYINKLSPNHQHKFVLMRDYDTEHLGKDVPDPYFGGSDGFKKVFEIIYRSCQSFLEKIKPPVS